VKFLDQLQHLFQDPSVRRKVKVLITSRPHILVALYFTATEISLDACSLKSDITTFAVSEVNKLPQFSAMAQEIQQVLIDGANGMFLWVSLILDDLKTSFTSKPRIIREKLKTLPSTLPDLYKDILRKIKPENQPAANTILQWVVWAMRPLTLKELTIATAIRPHDTSLSTMEDEMELDMKTVLRLIFGPMLKIEANDTVHLVHQSARDFLRSNNLSSQSPALWNLSSTKSNLLLATSCLTYLSFDELECGPVTPGFTSGEHHKQLEILENRKIENQLLSYAAENWSHHTSQTDHEDLDLLRTFCKLAQSEPKINLAYQIFVYSQKETFKHTSPLHIAADFGFINFIKDLLDSNVDINARAGIYSTALQVAVAKGHETVIRLLLGRGADINAQGGEYGNALQAASKEGNMVIVHLLLDRGADVNAQGGRYGNALRAASFQGNCAIVHLLLDSRADINAQGGLYGTALEAASSESHEAIVRLLLERGADINAQHNGILGNALHAASTTRNEAIVRLLLDWGADVNAQGGFFDSTALQLASVHRNENIVCLLLDRGADVNFQDSSGATALQNASVFGNDDIVRLLLDRGADIDMIGGWDHNAIEAAAKSGKETTVRLLLDRGADVNISSGLQAFALDAAAQNDNGAIFDYIRRNGNNFRGPGWKCNPAHMNDRETLVRLLVDGGVHWASQQDELNSFSEYDEEDV